MPLKLIVRTTDLSYPTVMGQRRRRQQQVLLPSSPSWSSREETTMPNGTTPPCLRDRRVFAAVAVVQKGGGICFNNGSISASSSSSSCIVGGCFGSSKIYAKEGLPPLQQQQQQQRQERIIVLREMNFVSCSQHWDLFVTTTQQPMMMMNHQNNEVGLTCSLHMALVPHNDECVVEQCRGWSKWTFVGTCQACILRMDMEALIASYLGGTMMTKTKPTTTGQTTMSPAAVASLRHWHLDVYMDQVQDESYCCVSKATSHLWNHNSFCGNVAHHQEQAFVNDHVLRGPQTTMVYKTKAARAVEDLLTGLRSNVGCVTMVQQQGNGAPLSCSSSGSSSTPTIANSSTDTTEDEEEKPSKSAPKKDSNFRLSQLIQKLIKESHDENHHGHHHASSTQLSSYASVVTKVARGVQQCATTTTANAAAGVDKNAYVINRSDTAARRASASINGTSNNDGKFDRNARSAVSDWSEVSESTNW